MKIRTSHDRPPIPTTACDWSAVTDEYDGAEDAGPQCVGYGKTEHEAIEDLVEQLIDRAQEDAYAEGRKDEAEEQAANREDARRFTADLVAGK
jgi:hypothetical protein